MNSVMDVWSLRCLEDRQVEMPNWQLAFQPGVQKKGVGHVVVRVWAPQSQNSTLVFFVFTSNFSHPPTPMCHSSQSVGLVLGLMWTIWSLMPRNQTGV